MRIASPKEMREAERLAIEEGTPSLDLMEAAGKGAAALARELLGGDPSGKTVLVVCGKGNNGGDGFVVARFLLEAGAHVSVFTTFDLKLATSDAAANLERLRSRGFSPIDIARDGVGALAREAARADLLVDAIFGTGFDGEVTEPTASVIDAMNRSGVPILALDVPSGVHGGTGTVAAAAVRARATATFALPKLGLVFYPGRAHAGEVRVVDIGIREEYWDRAGIATHLITPSIAARDLPHRAPDAHKGDCGRVLVVGGSPGLTGAVALAATAALRAGAGLVTAAVPSGLQDLLAVKLTEVMTRGLAETIDRTFSVDAASQVLGGAAEISALALGPGLSRATEAAEAARLIALELGAPVVLDADGLNAFEGNIDRLAGAKGPRVLTPHFGEAARLLGVSTATLLAAPLDGAREIARRAGAVAVLKGAPTLVATPRGEVFVNTTGNAGLATGGTGDVLTGLIAGFLAQGASPVEAARVGVHVHGLAGDLGASRLTEWGLIAGDVVSLVPEALFVLSSGTDEPWIS